MGDIIPFVFKHDEQQITIRTVVIDGDPWFVAPDACRGLGIGNTANAIKPLDADERGVYIINTPGGPQEVSIISEPGLYKLIQGSRKPAARKFDRFVRHEILPSIRRTGRYELGSGHGTPAILTAINGVQAELVLVNGRLGAIESELQGRRKNFGVAAERYAYEGVAKHNNCECPYCDDVVIVTKTGQDLGNSQLHHGNGNRKDIRPENCMPACDDCHLRLTEPSRPDHIPHHEAIAVWTQFHRKLRNKTRQIKATARVAGGFWDFRAATQVDMGWGRSRRKRSA